MGDASARNILASKSFSPFGAPRPCLEVRLQWGGGHDDCALRSRALCLEAKTQCDGASLETG